MMRNMHKINSRKMPQDKICLICGDKAIGYNFNVMTCKSCKAFFRRTVVNNKPYKCPFKNDCKINIVTRRYCQKCRYEKCLALGMIKENIGSLKEKLTKIIGTVIRNKSNNGEDESDSVPNAINLLYEVMKTTPTNPSEFRQNVKIIPQANVRAMPQQPVSTTTTAPDGMQSTSTKQIQLMQNGNFKPQASGSDMSQEPFSIALNESSSIQSTTTDVTQFVQNSKPNNQPQAGVSALSHQPFSSTSNEPDHISIPLTFSQAFENTPISVDNENKHSDINWPKPSSSQALSNVNSFNVIEVYQPSNNSSVNNFSYMHGTSYDSIYNEVEKEDYEKECRNSFPIGSGARIIKNKLLVSSTVQEMFNIAVSADYSELANRSGISCFGTNMLTTIEFQKLNELICANPCSEHVLNFSEEEREFFKKKPNELFPKFIDAIDFGIRRFIKFSKNISAFKQLCEEDQIALLKGSCTEALNVCWALTYDSKIAGWEFPEVLNFKLDELKEIKGNIHEEYKQFVQSFDSSWKNEEAIIFIILAIILFTPTRPNILHPEIIAKELHSYYFLLLRYLESKYSRCDAKVQFMKFIQTVQEVKQLNENHFKVFCDASPQYVGPLMTEIFDL